jgi:tRNA 2-selenouridine synthase SelU
MLVTENLYLGAYALANGAQLKGVVVARSNGRKTVVFELDAPHVQRLADEFYKEEETAVVNVAAFRQALEELKDELFAALRRTESERENDAAAQPRRARSAQARG